MDVLADTVDEILNLNVGGCTFTTSRSTLTRYPDSMLGSMFSGHLPSNVDDHGRYVIDRDGPTFRHILNFLRHSKLILPDGFKEWDILSAEADYYQLQELSQFIGETRKRIRQRDTYEFLEVEWICNGNPYPWYIFGESKLIDQLLATDIDYFICKYTRKEHHTRAFSEKVVLNGCTGYKLKPRNENPELCRLRLFRGITKLGFTLLSTCSSGRGYKWTFSRKEFADD